MCRLSFNVDQATHLEAAKDVARVDSALLNSPTAKEGPTESVTRKLADDYVSCSFVSHLLRFDSLLLLFTNCFLLLVLFYEFTYS